MELFSPGHLIVLAIIVAVLFFGWKQLPDMSRSLGRSLRIFKTEMKGMTDDDGKREAAQSAQTPPAAPQQAAAPAASPAPLPVALPVAQPATQPVQPAAQPVAPPAASEQPTAAPTAQPAPEATTSGRGEPT